MLQFFLFVFVLRVPGKSASVSVPILMSEFMIRFMNLARSFLYHRLSLVILKTIAFENYDIDRMSVFLYVLAFATSYPLVDSAS